VSVGLLPGCEAKPVDPGKATYMSRCAYCHGADGAGRSTGPQLVAPWLETALLARIVLDGLHGPLEVGGQGYNARMPGFRTTLHDEQIAALVHYIQLEAGGTTMIVRAETIGTIRETTGTRDTPWTPSELLALPDRSTRSETKGAFE
jgi:mono/diheme cytochrome c family protein